MHSLRRRRSPVVAITLAVVTMLTVASTTMATFPGRNGRITFMRDDPNGFAQVRVADSDLSHARQLTDYQATSGWSAWSPDGSRSSSTATLPTPTTTMTRSSTTFSR